MDHNFQKTMVLLKVEYNKQHHSVTQAISGAAVSEQEAERITKLIPQVGDTEATLKQRLQALR